MAQHVIAVTTQHDAVDYPYFVKLADDCNFMLFMSRDIEAKRRNMVFMPRSYTTNLNHHDLIKKLDSNSPLLITYEIQTEVV